MLTRIPIPKRNFDKHQQSDAGGNKDVSFPSILEASAWDWKQKAVALLEEGSLDKIEKPGVERLLRENLISDSKLQTQALSYILPDVENIVTLVNESLNAGHSFGSISIHYQLTQPQLDQLLEVNPSLNDDTNFVNSYVNKLAPSPDADSYSNTEEELYLSKLYQFVKKLSPVKNYLKATVIFLLLQHNYSVGKMDKQLFLEYLQLPKEFGYVSATFIQKVKRRKEVIQNLCSVGTFPSPSREHEEQLTKNYLMHFFLSTDNYNEFIPYIDQNYLKLLFAETKLLYGQGNAEDYLKLIKSISDANANKQEKKKVVWREGRKKVPS